MVSTTIFLNSMIHKGKATLKTSALNFTSLSTLSIEYKTKSKSTKQCCFEIDATYCAVTFKFVCVLLIYSSRISSSFDIYNSEYFHKLV